MCNSVQGSELQHPIFHYDSSMIHIKEDNEVEPHIERLESPSPIISAQDTAWRYRHIFVHELCLITGHGAYIQTPNLEVPMKILCMTTPLTYVVIMWTLGFYISKNLLCRSGIWLTAECGIFSMAMNAQMHTGARPMSSSALKKQANGMTSSARSKASYC